MVHVPREIELQTEKISVVPPEGIPPRLVAAYIDRCLAALPAAVTALNQCDFAHMKVLGHRLRGSGGAYGIPALTEIGSAIESAALKDDAKELRLQVAALEACLNRMEIRCDGGRQDAVNNQP